MGSRGAMSWAGAAGCLLVRGKGRARLPASQSTTRSPLPEAADAGAREELAMPTRTLPDHPSLENLKKQAKDLARDYRAGRPEAVARVAAGRPNVATAPGGRRFTLADAQLVVAREYGLKSWPRLLQHLALDAGRRRCHELDILFQEIRGV